MENSRDNLGKENPEQQNTPKNLEVSLMCSQGEGSYQKGSQRKVSFLIEKLLSLQLDSVVNSQMERKQSQKQSPKVFCEKKVFFKI